MDLDDEPLVRVDGVTKVFSSAGLIALESATLAIRKGEIVALLGPSGCGKSTILNIIAGLEPPTEGTVRYRGEAVSAPLTEVGIAFQSPYLLEWRTVLENVLLQMDVRHTPRSRRRYFVQAAKTLLHDVGLEGFADRHVWELSGGMKQRVSLCRSLIHDPDLLLLDEPFGALDMLTRDQLNVDLSELAYRRQKTALLVTHSISEAVFLADRVLVMSQRPGKIIADIAVGLPMPRELSMRGSSVFAECESKVYGIFERAGVLEGRRDS